MPETPELLALIRSRSPIIVIESREELRIKELVFQVCYSVKLPVYAWNIVDGLKLLGKSKQSENHCFQPSEVLNYLWNMKIGWNCDLRGGMMTR